MPDPQWRDLASHYCGWNVRIVGTFRDWHASQEPPPSRASGPGPVSPRHQSPGPRLIHVMTKVAVCGIPGESQY